MKMIYKNKYLIGFLVNFDIFFLIYSLSAQYLNITKDQNLQTFETWGPAYQLEFDFYLEKLHYTGEVMNIFHFTIEEDVVEVGDRIPAMFIDNKAKGNENMSLSKRDETNLH